MANAAETAHTLGQDRVEEGLLDYLRILWRHKLIIALTVMIATGAVVGLDRVRTRTYQGIADLLFSYQGAAGSGSAGGLTPTDVVTDIQLVQSAPVQALVAKDLHAGAPRVAVTEVGTTDVAQIAVRSTSPAFAADAANAYARAYIQVSTNDFVSSQLITERQIQAQITAVQNNINTISGQLSGASPLSGTATSTQLQAELTGLYGQLSSLQTQLSQVQLVTAQGATGGELVTPAVVDRVPVSPKRAEDAVIAGAVGLLLGIGFALLRDFLDDRIRDVDDLTKAAGGLPTIGLIPALPDWRDRKAPFLVTSERPRSPAAEAYRALRTSIQFMALESPTKLLQITSPGAIEGKTTTSANLSFVMAEAGQRVVLVDCDLRRPRVHEFFHVANTVGLTSVLLGKVPLEKALIKVAGNGSLLVLPAGPIPPNPSELLSGEGAAQLFQSLAEGADVVVLDSSPLLPVTDAVALAARAEGVLLVGAAGVSAARAITRSLELLSGVGARVIGVVLNRAPEAASYSYYRYGYGYGSELANGNGMAGKAPPAIVPRQAR